MKKADLIAGIATDPTISSGTVMIREEQGDYSSIILEGDTEEDVIKLFLADILSVRIATLLQKFPERLDARHAPQILPNLRKEYQSAIEALFRLCLRENRVPEKKLKDLKSEIRSECDRRMKTVERQLLDS